MLDEAFDTEVAILHKYSDQRDCLKSAQRKALDVLNTVGLSNSVLKLIEKRHRVDKWIVYGGMIITVVLMVVFGDVHTHTSAVLHFQRCSLWRWATALRN